MASEAPHARKSRLAVPVGGGDPVVASPSNSGTRSKVNVSAAAAAAAVSTPAANRPMQYLQRLTDIRQMDIQSALDQMKTLLSTRPQTVYKTAYYRKQTKNHWARDDPAFVALQAVFLVIASIAYSVAFRIKVPGAISFLLSSVLWNWLGMGILLATAGREIANRHLTNHQSSSHVRQQVEWLYAFDIHCNSFFPVFVILCK
jgi:UNC-50 family